MLGLGLACAAPTPGDPPAPDIRPAEVARRVERSSALEEPLQAVFKWRLNESGSRLSGRGVARVEPPYRARLDLFLDNGETAARAALVDDDLRVPPGMDRRLVPPAPLLWAALGVLRPGAGVPLVGGRALGDGIVELRYRSSGARELRFRVRDAGVLEAEIVRDGHATERVQVVAGRRGSLPAEARYRDLAAFRELVVSLESVERVESHPSEIWRPGG